MASPFRFRPERVVPPRGSDTRPAAVHEQHTPARLARLHGQIFGMVIPNVSAVRRLRQEEQHRTQDIREVIVARIGRRKLLKFAGASSVAARTGGTTAILGLGRAPAYAQATALHWLRWNDF